MSMIASVLHLDRKAIKALRITDPYSLHRVVYSLYEDVRTLDQKTNSKVSGIQFADQGGDFTSRRVLLLANRIPTDTIDGQHVHVESRAVPDSFLDHARYRFKVIVNPSRRDSSSRKLVPVKGREAIGQWFIERSAQSWGFEVEPKHLQVDKIEVLRFYGKSQNLVTICQAHIQGQFTVINREQFRSSFTQGIGRSRSFGCGLLQIIPILDSPLI